MKHSELYGKEPFAFTRSERSIRVLRVLKTQGSPSRKEIQEIAFNPEALRKEKVLKLSDAYVNFSYL